MSVTSTTERVRRKLRTKFQTSEEKDRYFKITYDNWKARDGKEPSKFWKECQERLKNYHTTRHSFDPIYMSDDFREFNIRQLPNGKWKIVYYNGKTPKEVSGLFTNFNLAEQRLVNWLKRYNKGYARYPGCPKPKQTNSTEHFLKDWSPKRAP